MAATSSRALNAQADETAVISLAVSKAADMEDKSLVRAWREYKGLSQADMAERLGISRPACARLEAKGVQAPRGHGASPGRGPRA